MDTTINNSVTWCLSTTGASKNTSTAKHDVTSRIGKNPKIPKSICCRFLGQQVCSTGRSARSADSCWSGNVTTRVLSETVEARLNWLYLASVIHLASLCGLHSDNHKGKLLITSFRWLCLVQMCGGNGGNSRRLLGHAVLLYPPVLGRNLGACVLHFW